MTRLIKEKARELGADDVGVCELTPIIINEGSSFSHKYVISLLLEEKDEHVLGGALAIEIETIDIYVRCAEVSTELGKYIPSLTKLFMGERCKAGWRTPQWFLEDEEAVLNGGGLSEPLTAPTD